MKVKNENQLKENISNSVQDLENHFNEIRETKNRRNECQDKIIIAKEELDQIEYNFNSERPEGIDDAVTMAEFKVSRKNELLNIVEKNETIFCKLGDVDTQLAMKTGPLKEQCLKSRISLCEALSKEIMSTSEYKSLSKNLDILKALYLEAYKGYIRTDQILDEVGLLEVPSEKHYVIARKELFIK